MAAAKVKSNILLLCKQAWLAMFINFVLSDCSCGCKHCILEKRASWLQLRSTSVESIYFPSRGKWLDILCCIKPNHVRLSCDLRHAHLLHACRQLKSQISIQFVCKQQFIGYWQWRSAQSSICAISFFISFHHFDLAQQRYLVRNNLSVK